MSKSRFFGKTEASRARQLANLRREKYPGRSFTLIHKKKTHIEPHTGTLRGKGNLYDLGKIKVSVSGEVYQTSCGIEGL